MVLRFSRISATMSPPAAARCAFLSSASRLDDAFRAGGYPPPIRARYVRKIRSKIQEGLALGNREGRSS
jgi:hypothetical protein